MGLSRRQFFRNFWSVNDPHSPKRLKRYAEIETYARTRLFPYDFSLTGQQERELLQEVRSALEKASNEELFSTTIRARIEEVVEAKIQPWRKESDVVDRTERLRELRQVAPDYVLAFLEVQAGTPVIEQLKQMYGIYDLTELEASLKRQVALWISEVDDRLLAQYDLLSIQDLVFAQLRSWC